jgi:hypothetical protein
MKFSIEDDPKKLLQESEAFTAVMLSSVVVDSGVDLTLS